MDSRIILQKDSSIFLVQPGHTKPEEFLITGVKGSGGSCICYTAVLREKDRDVEGTLKEYYPLDAGTREFSFDFSRKKSEYPELRNQLYSKPSTIDNLRRNRSDYIAAYNELEIARIEFKDLNRFLPAPVIYKSFTGNQEITDTEAEETEENYTVYTWVRNDPQIITYKELLNGICIDTVHGINSEKNISLILNCILELSKGISLLHLAALYHLDLTPNNFGIKTYNKAVDENISLSLYDTNSVYSIGRNYYPSAGTEYFRSDEVKMGDSDSYGIQSDIYSVGTILYYSLVTEISGEGKDKKCTNKYYNGEYQGKEAYSCIASDLKNSSLLQVNDETENNILYGMLLSVIKKALNRYDDPIGNYKTMDELTGALSEIIAKFNFFISKKSFEDTGKYLLKTRLITKEESFAEQIKTGAAGALTLHLYRYPLYDYVPTGKKDINILVIGGGTYSSKFIDLAFELSQIKDCYASVTVASMDSDKDKITYLSSRPEFENFFEVDGKIPTKTDSPYGSLTYREINKIDADSEIKDIKALMSETQYSYIFIAVNDENINAYTAEKISRSLPSGANALISYVVYSGKTKKLSSGVGHIVSVNVRDTLEKSKEYKELKRMAFNVHLTWSSDGIADIKKAEGSFSNKYNFFSSLEAAVSIKYKLHSVGIDLNSEELRQNVKTVRYLLNQSKLKKDVRELVMYEHRRWNVGQIVTSWRTLTPDKYNLLTSSTKLRTKKLHPCLVAGNANTVLTQSKWTSNNFALWDTAQECDLEDLDDLDKMSIRLHQHFAGLADELKKNPIVLYSKISLLRALLSGSSELADCFELYCYSVNALFDKGANRETVKIYWYHLNAFSCSVKQHEHDIAQFPEVQKLFEDIQTMLFPLIEAGSYTDWKSKDCNIINNIPFILSYSPAIHICVPMALAEKKASTDILFSNAASALVLNPSIVTYVVDGEAVKKSFGGFINTISYISNIFKKHRLQTKINITVFEKSGTGDILNLEKLKEEFSLINYIEEIEYGGPDEISVYREYLNESLHSKTESRRFTAIEYNDTKFSGLLQGANYLGKNVSEDEQSVNAEKICYSTLFPYYTYDSKMQRFTASDDCRYFAYVINKPHLNVDDLFYAKGKHCNVYEPEMQSDYMFFWDLFREKPDAWKELCSKLKIKCEIEIASVDSNALSKEIVSEAQFIVPAFCENTLKLVINEMKCSQLGILSGYSLTYRTSRSLTLILTDVSMTVVNFFSKLLANPMAISDSTLINIIRKSSGFTVASYRMNVSDLSLSTCNYAKDIGSFLQRIAEKHYISSFNIKDSESQTAEFSFSSIHILRLMINEGNIFELYVYYKMLESGQFDDVRNSVVISWNESGASNELDIVATKGFRTIIIECKARNELEAEFYNKLYPIGDVFGVNNTIVLLADINTDELSASNAMQKSRGEELGITTFWKTPTFITEIIKLMKE